MRRALTQMISLAVPVVLAELGWIAMSVVDTIMVGHLGPAAIGAAGVGSILFETVCIGGIGLLLSLDTLVSQAFGAGNISDCNHSLRQGVLLCLLMTPPFMAIMLLFPPLMRQVGVHPEVFSNAAPYINAIGWSTLPLLIYSAFRRYLQGMSLVRPVMFALVTANLVNVAANWVLINGKLGAPALGVPGAGWATLVSRIYMAGVLIGYAAWREARGSTALFTGSWRPDGWRLGELLRLGIPASGQLTLEIGVFGVASMLAGKLDPASLPRRTRSL